MTRRTLLSSLAGLIALITSKTGLARPREATSPACASGMSESITWHAIAEEGPPPVIFDEHGLYRRYLVICTLGGQICIACLHNSVLHGLEWVTCGVRIPGDRIWERVLPGVTHWPELPHGPASPVRA